MSHRFAKLTRSLVPALITYAVLAGAAVRAEAPLPGANQEFVAVYNLVLPRSITLGKLDVAVAKAPLDLALNGRHLSSPARIDGYYVYLLVVPVDYKKETALLTAAEGGRKLEQSIPVAPHENSLRDVGSINLSGETAQITTNQSNQARIDDENKRISALLGTCSTQQFTLPFANPLAAMTVTSGFAKKRNYYGEGQKYLYSSYHLGLDLRAAKGTPVYSAGDGTVLFAEPTLTRGNAVYVDHGLGLITSYFHLDQILVKAGDRIAKGAVLGAAGSTGISTAAHLHWGLVAGGLNADPLSLLTLEARVKSAAGLFLLAAVQSSPSSES